jgi:predicted outer membrane repeat protein
MKGAVVANPAPRTPALEHPMNPLSRRLSSILGLTLSAAGLLAPAVASAGSAGINGVNCGFATIQAAINAAPDGGTVFVSEGVQTDPGFVVTKRLTIRRGTSACQAGGAGMAVIDFAGAGHAEIADDLSAVVFEDLSLLRGASSTQGGGILVGERSNLDLRDSAVSLSNADEGGGVYVSAGATLEADGLLLVGNTAEDGGGIYGGPGATLDLSTSLSGDLHFASNTASGLGGGLLCAGCTLTIDRGVNDFADVVFEDNAADRGGAVAVLDGDSEVAEATVSTGSFEANEADAGGAFYLYTSGAMRLSGLDLLGNSARVGGALVADTASDVAIEGALFEGNVATALGGAIHSLSSDLLVETSRFEANAAAAGGAFLSDAEVPFHHSTLVDRCTFFDNTATGGSAGSAVEVRSAVNDLTLSNSQVVGGNSPVSPGAAVLALNGATLHLFDSTVAYNERWGVASVGGTVEMKGDIVWANTNGVTGAGLSAVCSDVQGGLLPGALNLSTNPLFTDPANADLTLQVGSPARDVCAAHPGTSLDNHDRSVNQTNMGAYDWN